MTPAPRTGIDFRKLYRELLADERDALIQLGLEFLSERLAEVDRRIERLKANHQQRYPNPHAIPGAEASRAQSYETERHLLESLQRASQDTPFIEIHRLRLLAARQRVTNLLRSGKNPQDSAKRAARYQAWLEQELLVDLRVKWLIWLRPSRWNNIGRNDR